MDKLYNESVRLTNFHVGTTCAPTRAGLMSGRDHNRVGVWHTINGRSIMRKEETTIAQIFKNSEYITGMFGKWHLGDNYPYRPQDRGFDEVLMHGGGGVGQSPDYWDNDYFDDVYFKNGYPTQTEGYCTDVWFDAAINFIENNKEKPFFCYVATNAPHSPFHVPQKYIDMYKDNEEIPNPNFYGMITNIDENLALLMQKLEELEIEENTIIVFMTDNGTAAGVNLNERGFAEEGFNAGMRGRKGSEYEGGHRIPFFIRWKNGNLVGGKDINLLTTHTDIAPTLIDLCNLEKPDSVRFDGTSLAPLFKGDSSNVSDRTLIVDTQREELPEKWKNSSVMTQKWRLIRGRELYDMERDPSQRRNVAQYYPRIVRELREEYETWWAGLEPTFDDYAEIPIGSNDFPVRLTAHDWHTEMRVPWNQATIRNGIISNGYWVIGIEESGKYEFDLRRWPSEIVKPFNANLPEGDSIPGGSRYQKGVGLEYVSAKIQVGDIKDSTSVYPTDHTVRFTLDLTEGEKQLHTSFIDTAGIERGAYFVYVKKVSDNE
jgi:arylsulfatase A-like enzyme